MACAAIMGDGRRYDEQVPDETATVLVVEDDASSRRGYELLLRLSGYRVVAVANAEDALERLRTTSFDLIVSDVNMPRIDGFELVRQLRNESATRDVPIILLSAVADSQRKVTGLDRGADDFLAKPVDVDELLARIRMHLRHSARNRELVERSRYDVVTGVLNRSAIDDELDRELKRAARTRLPLSVLMVDIDAFKSFNDRYGHQVGDAALNEVAQKLQMLVRETDYVGRYGGDELLVVLPDTNAESASEVTDRIDLEWRKHPPVPRGTTQPVLISVGAATATGEITRESLIEVADRRMYDQKGRTRFGTTKGSSCNAT
jgi:diguanylate cyclase (GGDEF)-like protein